MGNGKGSFSRRVGALKVEKFSFFRAVVRWKALVINVDGDESIHSRVHVRSVER